MAVLTKMWSNIFYKFALILQKDYFQILIPLSQAVSVSSYRVFFMCSSKMFRLYWYWSQVILKIPLGKFEITKMQWRTDMSLEASLSQMFIPCPEQSVYTAFGYLIRISAWVPRNSPLIAFKSNPRSVSRSLIVFVSTFLDK